jgi:hypothetical protein
MTVELQTVVDRLELVEKQNRTLRWWCVLAVLVALATAAASFLMPQPAPSSRARYSAVETNRLLLRDLQGRTVGGMEVDRSGTIRLVLGATGGSTGAAFLEVRGDSVVDFTLRGADGAVRAALVGSRTPSLLLAPEGMRPTASLLTAPDGGASIVLVDGQGRLRFRAP